MLLHYEPAVPHLWSSSFIAETEKGIGRPGRPEIYPGLEIAFPGGSKRYAPVGIASAAHGGYEPRLLPPFPTIARSVNERTNNLSDLEVEVEISDAGDRAADRRQLGIRLATYRQSYRNSVATIRLLSPNVSDADSPIVFSGVVDTAEQVRPLVWRLRLRLADSPLKYGFLPRAIISQADWPSAHFDALGQYIPIIYGTHNSTGITAAGFVPCHYVDQLGFRYLVGLGHMKTIRTVYSAGVAVDTANYAVTYPTVNGKLVTLIDFTATQGTNDVTVDLDGLSDKADGTGNLISNPAEVLQHLLVNFVFGDWRSGEYLSASTAPIHAPSFVETANFLSARGHECSRRLSVPMRALDLVNEWADNHGAKLFWKGNGQLAVRMNDPNITRLYTDEQWFHADEDEAGAFALRSDAQGITREISLPYLFGETEGKFYQGMIASDLSVAQKVAISLDQPWSASRVV
jgi:hypothetical protein